MNNFREYAKTLTYKGMDSFPWEHHPEDEGFSFEWLVPAGVVVRHERETDGHLEYVLYGHEMAGWRTNGCSCCSTDYDHDTANLSRDRMYKATGWAWVWK